MGVNVTLREQIKALEVEDRQLNAELEQARADLDFVAIMADVDIDDDEEE